MHYEDCVHFHAVDITPWHGDVFDHPSYEYYCNQDGEEKLTYPAKCIRCMKKRGLWDDNN